MHTKNALEKKEGKWSKLKNERAAPSNFKIQFLAPSIYIGLVNSLKFHGNKKSVKFHVVFRDRKFRDTLYNVSK